jgi:PKHD-type hydroxylase
MPSYRIKPAPAMVDPNIKIVDQPVSRELALYIRELGEERIVKDGAEPGRVGFHEATVVDRTRREAETQWLLFPWEDERTGVVYEAMEEIVQQVNALHWQYDITDYQDMFHYIRYTAPTGHFQWHQDKGDTWRRVQRKLSFTLLLSEPAEYEGGDFEFFDGDPIRVMERKIGDVLVFPSYLQHRVTAVTQGVRRSLVGWASGPRFK